MRVKGTGVAHTGDVVPLDGIKGPGSANTYFDGYAYNKHVGVPVAPKAKPIVRIMFICGYLGMCMMLYNRWKTSECTALMARAIRYVLEQKEDDKPYTRHISL